MEAFVFSYQTLSGLILLTWVCLVRSQVFSYEVAALCDLKTSLNPTVWGSLTPCGSSYPCDVTLSGVICDETSHHVISL